jgi:hypothetical protein
VWYPPAEINGVAAEEADACCDAANVRLASMAHAKSADVREGRVKID